jgi:hypothetical protein
MIDGSYKTIFQKRAFVISDYSLFNSYYLVYVVYGKKRTKSKIAISLYLEITYTIGFLTGWSWATCLAAI